MPDDCLFCRMAGGAIPVDKVHEDDLVFAIRDINPQAPTHVLVIPVRHVASAADLTAQDNEHRSALDWAKGVFLATHPAEPKPSSIALITSLLKAQGKEIR